MKYTAQLTQAPIAVQRTGDCWFLIRVQSDDGDEIVAQGRPHDGRGYHAGSQHLNDVLMGAIRSVVDDLPQRTPKRRVLDSFEGDDPGVERLRAGLSLVVEVDGEDLNA